MFQQFPKPPSYLRLAYGGQLAALEANVNYEAKSRGLPTYSLLGMENGTVGQKPLLVPKPKRYTIDGWGVALVGTSRYLCCNVKYTDEAGTVYDFGKVVAV